MIPEDPGLDQYILKPVVERIFADFGKSPRVTVLPNPRLRGVAQALNSAILADIVATYPMNDLFLVLVDRDGDGARSAVANARENAMRELGGQWRGVLDRCTELKDLKRRIEAWLNT